MVRLIVNCGRIVWRKAKLLSSSIASMLKTMLSTFIIIMLLLLSFMTAQRLLDYYNFQMLADLPIDELNYRYDKKVVLSGTKNLTGKKPRS